MDNTKLRAKWQKSISEVDEDFLILIDEIYESYRNHKPSDFFDNLPDDIQNLLLISKKQSDDHQTSPHSEVVKEIRAKYNVK
ncbi:hypothetical protein [Flavobacterium sp. CS20]|jgi:hypothetical protein|uniref:hypothetical protein n=1 Tax=Flavobacterium sp. CS20 TaxID=2775246 RepID=UPI001B3A057B|nr:hypothetical protein [Flavobacterium sp. CS20]QTY26530.1 hypothetical protein IGB25_11485 [Flavobacterium sp. CS20]